MLTRCATGTGGDLTIAGVADEDLHTFFLQPSSDLCVANDGNHRTLFRQCEFKRFRADAATTRTKNEPWSHQACSFKDEDNA